MSNGEYPAAKSTRISKSEAEMGKELAVLRAQLDEVRRDFARLENRVDRASGPHPIDRTTTGPHVVVQPNGRRDLAVGSSAAVGGVSLYVLVEWLARIVGELK